MKKANALWLGLILGVLGVGLLWLKSTQLAAAFAFLTILVYLAAYTPLKRRSAWCTLLGAVSGALPPVIGWAAAESSDRSMAYVLFGILFCWQLPHFLAIAWMYKHEYEAAGFVRLKRGDESGLFTAYQALGFSILLALVAFVPAMLGRMSPFYNVGAGLANAMLAGSCVVFLLERSRGAARRLFFASIVYLPVMLLFLVFTRKVL
jgi:protoheme IX farnesyltransferase